MLFSITTAIAQSTSYTAFEWDIVGIGISIPIGEDNLKGGIAMGGELRYNATDNISIGIGSEFSFFDGQHFMVRSSYTTFTHELIRAFYI